jgi:hypothetical protein
VAALVLVTSDARQAPSMLLAKGRMTMMAGGLEVTTTKEGSGETAAVSVCLHWLANCNW